MLVLQRFAGIVLALLGAVAAIVFTSILLAVVAVLAALFGGWLWWRTRALRREARRAAPSVIEGEYRVETETQRLERR